MFLIVKPETLKDENKDDLKMKFNFSLILDIIILLVVIITWGKWERCIVK